MTTVGLINPGEMGASVGAAVRNAEVIWAGEHRSDASKKRASDAGLKDCGNLSSLVDDADIILSVCPPHEATTVADAVSALDFDDMMARRRGYSATRSTVLTTS